MRLRPYTRAEGCRGQPLVLQSLPAQCPFQRRTQCPSSRKMQQQGAILQEESRSSGHQTLPSLQICEVGFVVHTLSSRWYFVTAAGKDKKAAGPGLRPASTSWPADKPLEPPSSSGVPCAEAPWAAAAPDIPAFSVLPWTCTEHLRPCPAPLAGSCGRPAGLARRTRGGGGGGNPGARGGEPGGRGGEPGELILQLGAGPADLALPSGWTRGAFQRGAIARAARGHFHAISTARSVPAALPGRGLEGASPASGPGVPEKLGHPVSFLRSREARAPARVGPRGARAPSRRAGLVTARPAAVPPGPRWPRFRLAPDSEGRDPAGRGEKAARPPLEAPWGRAWAPKAPTPPLSGIRDKGGNQVHPPTCTGRVTPQVIGPRGSSTPSPHVTGAGPRFHA